MATRLHCAFAAACCEISIIDLRDKTYGFMVLISVNQQSISPDLCMFYIMSSLSSPGNSNTMSIKTNKQNNKTI